MDSKDKKALSEVDICDLFITPAINKAGWDPMRQIRREVTLAPGPVIVRGNMASRNKKKKKFADYVLSWEPGVPIAIVEAKDNNHPVSHGIQQALGYAEILEVPSAFSSNGDAFASHNKVPAPGEEIETEFPLESCPPPQMLWRRYKQFRGVADEAEPLVLQPYHDDPAGKEPRYYQVDAINRTIEAVASGKRRVLLVMATGTGKTYTTFQIIWRLWKADVVKRVLFLVDRNILVDQTLVNDFKPFGPVMTKVRNRKIDPAYEIYLGLYQAITGPDEADKIFKNVSREFFDMVVIDECHRGSASDDHLRTQGRTAGIDAVHIEDLLARGEYETVIAQIETSRGRGVFVQEIRDAFTRTGTITDTTLLITELFTDTVITTNYDCLIEQAFDTGVKNAFQVINGLDALARPDTDRVSIIKLHGDVRTPGQCILSRNQYDEAYGNSGVDLSLPIPKLLEYYYTNSNLLFLGCSLKGDRTVQVFRAIQHEIQQKYGDVDIPQHFAIEQAPESEQALSDRNAYMAEL